MSPRPSSSSRIGGCFLLVFFGLFMVFPLFVAWLVNTQGAKVSGSITVMYIVLGVFFLVGLFGVIYGIKNLLQGPKPPGKGGKLMAQYSGIPKAPEVQKLANGYYRLNPEASHKAQFWTLLAVALFWNGITWTVFLADSKDSDDSPVWFIAIFMIVGALIFAGAIWNLLKWLMVGETHVDINEPNPTPGQKLEILVSQPGRYSIDRLSIHLVCKEKATYRQGTDTKTKTEIVREAPVCDLEQLTSRDGQILAHQACQVPTDAMPGFASSNNEITWMIRVKMVLPGRPDVEQFYPFRIMAPDVKRIEVGGRG